MKKIVVISDSHGNRAAIDKLAPILDECDLIIHLGDTSADGNYVAQRFADKTIVINGNCDPIKLGDDERVITVEDIKIFACHGDKYGVKYTYDRLAYKCAQEGCSVGLFGHTHVPTEKTLGTVTLFNPGTLKRYSTNTYLYLVVTGDRAVGKICPLQ